MAGGSDLLSKDRAIGVVDSDSHVWEPAVIWQKYLDREFRQAVRSALTPLGAPAADDAFLVNGTSSTRLNQGDRIRQALWRPSGRADEEAAQTHISPRALDPSERLEDMDRMGVKHAVVFPTVMLEHLPTVSDADLAWALCRAYNDWISEFCSGGNGRLHAVGVLPWQEVTFARRELERIVSSGISAVLLRPAFINGRYPNYPYYDPLWQQIDDAGVTVCVHPSAGSTNPEGTSIGTFLERIAKPLRIGHFIAEVGAPLMDNANMLTALAFYGHMETYPDLPIAYFHSGASWLPLVLEKIETYLWVSSIDPLRPVSLDPDAVFHERPSLVTFDTWEFARLEDLESLTTVGAWGSRYPHHDATDARDALGAMRAHGLSDQTIRTLMRDNAMRIFRIADPEGAGANRGRRALDDNAVGPRLC